MIFEEFVRDRVDKGEIVFGSHIRVRTTEDMFKCIAKYGISINRSLIYNYEDDKCYYFYDNKLYKLSVSFEEVEIEQKKKTFRWFEEGKI